MRSSNLAVHSVTYYGDGERDKAAAHSLGWQFVAVGKKLGGLLHFTLGDVRA